MSWKLSDLLTKAFDGEILPSFDSTQELDRNPPRPLPMKWHTNDEPRTTTKRGDDERQEDNARERNKGSHQ